MEPKKKLCSGSRDGTTETGATFWINLNIVLLALVVSVTVLHTFSIGVAATISSFSATPKESSVLQDTAGNLHFNSTEGQSVFISGFDVHGIIQRLYRAEIDLFGYIVSKFPDQLTGLALSNSSTFNGTCKYFELTPEQNSTSQLHLNVSATLLQDTHGNLHITTMSNQSVCINGIEFFEQAVQRVQRVEDAIERISGPKNESESETKKIKTESARFACPNGRGFGRTGDVRLENGSTNATTKTTSQINSWEIVRDKVGNLRIQVSGKSEASRGVHTPDKEKLASLQTNQTVCINGVAFHAILERIFNAEAELERVLADSVQEPSSFPTDVDAYECSCDADCDDGCESCTAGNSLKCNEDCVTAAYYYQEYSYSCGWRGWDTCTGYRQVYWQQECETSCEECCEESCDDDCDEEC